MIYKLEQFTNDISVMHDNAEYVYKLVENTTNEDTKQTLVGIAMTIKGQAVLADMLLEVLKSKKQPPE